MTLILTSYPHSKNFTEVYNEDVNVLIRLYTFPHNPPFSRKADFCFKYMQQNFRPISREGAEKLFNRKSDPDALLTPKQFLKKKMPKTVDKVSSAFHAATQFGSHLKDVVKKDARKLLD